MTSELETNLVAVERITEYCDVPTEVIFMCLYLLVFLIEQSVCVRGHPLSDFQSSTNFFQLSSILGGLNFFSCSDVRVLRSYASLGFRSVE